MSKNALSRPTAKTVAPIPIGSGTLTAAFSGFVSALAGGGLLNVQEYGRLTFLLSITFNGADVEVEPQSSVDGVTWWPLSRTYIIGSPGGPERVVPVRQQIREDEWGAVADVPVGSFDVSTISYVRIRARGDGAELSAFAVMGR